jgi:hypothetical protein
VLLSYYGFEGRAPGILKEEPSGINRKTWDALFLELKKKDILNIL